MATLDSRIGDDVKFWNKLFPIVHSDATPEIAEWNYNNMLLTGEIQIETMLENCITKLGGPQKTSMHYMDFDDESDAKKVCARYRSKGKGYDGQITGVIKKIGSLRVMLYERITAEFYYFVIPVSAYKGLKHIEIPFHLNGEPKRITRNGIQKWWKYEVSSIEEMATKNVA
jgi:hypothetical protein